MAGGPAPRTAGRPPIGDFNSHFEIMVSDSLPGSTVTAGHLENRTDFAAVSFGDPTKGLAPPQSINPKVVNAALLFPFATDVQADRSDGP